MPFQRYNATWSSEYNDLAVEMYCIRKGGRWKLGLKDCGEGLPHHYERMRNILWPHLKAHRWHELCRDTILSSAITVLMGAASTGKTHSAAWVFLCEYFCFPEETCVLVSSTDLTGLKMRVWGEMVSLWQKAVNRFPELPGHLIDSRMLIATDDIDENEMDGDRIARDWRKGIKAIACIQGNKNVGLGKYVGIKQVRTRMIADEAQFMAPDFLKSFANLGNQIGFRAVILGNPNDPTDPLGKAAEPKVGWSKYMKPDRTVVWDTRFMDGKCVNLVGTDSPNFDVPPDDPIPFPFLISRQTIAKILTWASPDSIEFYSQCLGVMQVGIMARRVLERDMCIQCGATSDVTWRANSQTRIGGLDAAYGGDRCVAGFADFGVDANGETVISISPPVQVPVAVRDDMTAEDQIATWARQYATENDIKPGNFFHDSTGRGSLGTALSRIWSNLCNPVEFGGKPSKRPVSLDSFIDDPETGMKRLLRCDEHYDRLITELCFSVRYVVEGKQMRNLPTDVMEEFTLRKWDLIRGNKKWVEPKSGSPTKPGFKQRIGYSPDLADWLCIIIEGARQRGFEIKKLGGIRDEESGDDYFKLEAERYAKAIKSNLLSHT